MGGFPHAWRETILLGAMNVRGAKESARGRPARGDESSIFTPNIAPGGRASQLVVQDSKLAANLEKEIAVEYSDKERRE